MNNGYAQMAPNNSILTFAIHLTKASAQIYRPANSQIAHLLVPTSPSTDNFVALVHTAPPVNTAILHTLHQQVLLPHQLERFSPWIPNYCQNLPQATILMK